MASPLLSIRGDRTLPKGIATARWDEEGVETGAFDLISKGTLVDYQTTREQAHWLAPWYAKQGKAVQSHACAAVSSAIDMPLQFSPNLVMEPGTDAGGFNELVASVPKGLALIDGFAAMDFQSRTGLAMPTFNGYWREIVDGKLGDFVESAAMSFSSSELWKTLLRIGDAKSQDSTAYKESKGEPKQPWSLTVAAVPTVFKDGAIINPNKR